jgi:hypothetical protein
MKRVIFALCASLLAFGSSAASAATYYVAPAGNDANPGTAARPLATLQAAVNRLQPGDTLLVHGGTYRETVVFPRNGTAEKPITLKSCPGEKVIVSGCDPVAGWQLHEGRIWKAPMNWTLGLGRNQVFSAGEVMIEARHPNAPAQGLEMYVAGLSPLWPAFGEFSIPKETRVSQPGRIVSRLLDGQPNDYWKGGLYYGIHFEGWSAQTGVIESSKPGEILVGDRTQGWWFGSAYNGKFPQEHEEGRGMIVGHLHALDQPGEWHWQANTLYLMPPGDGEPRAVEAKRRQVAFDLSGREHLRIEGLSVHAASMRLDGSAHCTVDRCRLAYIAHYTRQYGIGQIEHGRDTIRSGETGIFVGGHDNAFLNCSVRFSAGTGFHLRGYHHTIHNCLIDEVSYTAHYLNAITDAVSDYPDYEHFLVGGHVITFNTMRNAGRHLFNFYGNGPSLASRDRGPMDYAATLLAHNHLYNGMLLTRDAGFITSFYASGGTLNGLHSQVAYNVLHDCYDISAMRWNVLGMVYLDNGSREVDVHHNLFWAAPGSLQAGIWFNPPNINVSARDNVFHGLFTRTSAELRADDFPHGKPFRFGHDFDAPPPLPRWPQLDSRCLDAARCAEQSAGVRKTAAGLTGLKDGDWFSLGKVDFGPGWQSAVMRFASDAKAMNTDRSMRAPPRHQKATDPLVLEARAAEGTPGVKKVWTVFRVEHGGWLRFDRVTLGDGYRRFRAVYGTTGPLPRRIEVHLDRADGPLVGQAQLPPTDIPRRGSIQTFREAVGELLPAATGTHDVYFVCSSDDGKAVAEFEYFRFERSRGAIALAKNDVRLELRVGGKDGEKIGEFFPRFTGGPDEFRELVARLEPARGELPLYVVVRSALPGPIGAVASLRLEKACQPIDWSGIGLAPRSSEKPGGMVLPEPTNRPCARPADRYRQPPPARPFYRANRLATRPVVDGALKEWTGRSLLLEQSLEGAVCEQSPATAWVGHDDEALYVALRCPTSEGTPVVAPGHRWGDSDGVEIALQNAETTPPGPILSLRGWPDGYSCAPELAGVPPAVAQRLGKAVTYRTARERGAWTCEWRIPFAACGFTPASAPCLLCNLTVRNAAQDRWRTWSISGGATYDLNNGGILILGSGEAMLSGSLRQGLAVWLDAADPARVKRDAAGRVAAWGDKSGNDRHATQNKAAFQPRYLAAGLNGKPALEFDDARQTRLELPDLSDRQISATMFAVISNPQPGQPRNHNQRIFTASNGKEYDYLCGLSCSVPGTQTGGPRLIVAEAKDRWAQKVRVGCFSPNYHTFFKGTIAEILVYDRPLTREERFRVTAYLMGKWDL